MIPEAPLENTGSGLVAASEGWFVLNARDGRWRVRGGTGTRLSVEGDAEFPQVGVNLYVLAPGEPMGVYHWEADQEDFLVVSGEALLIVEGRERPLRPWDFVHCPAHTAHTIIGAGDGPSVVLAVGAREHQAGDDWGAYPVDEVASRHGAGVDRPTNDADEAYARFGELEWSAYREGWLPGS